MEIIYPNQKEASFRWAALCIIMVAFVLALLQIHFENIPLSFWSWLLWTVLGLLLNAAYHEANGRHSMIIAGFTSGVSLVAAFALVRMVFNKDVPQWGNIENFTLVVLPLGFFCWLFFRAEDAVMVLTTAAGLVLLPTFLNWQGNNPAHSFVFWVLCCAASLFELLSPEQGVYGERTPAEKFPSFVATLVSGGMIAGAAYHHYLLLRSH